MPGAASITGFDTIMIDGRIISDLADGNAVDITFPNDLAAAKAAKNGNTIFAENAMGRMGEYSLRVLLGSSDDKYLNSRKQEQRNSFSDFILLTGSFSKRVGDGRANISTKVYQAVGGIFKKEPQAMTSAEGNTDQSVVVYALQFARVDVSIQ